MPSRPTGLVLRMLFAVAGLLLITGALIVGVWAVFWFVFAALGVGVAGTVATAATLLVLALVGVAEYRNVATIEGLADADPVSQAEAPELYRTVTRVAAQLDVPVPTVALSDRDAPEALVVGFRPETMHLVLSRGVVDALSEAEFAAVVAHELAHVANRDAMVVTAVSLPVVLADGIRRRAKEAKQPDAGLVFAVPLRLLSTVVWIAGRTVLARLTRAREQAADRAAVEATGSPAALASALRTLDDGIASTPNRDLREVSGVSALSVLPLEPRELEKVMLGPDGESEPDYWWLRTRLHRVERWLFGSHPPTEQRIDALAARSSVD